MMWLSEFRVRALRNVWSAAGSQPGTRTLHAPERIFPGRKKKKKSPMLDIAAARLAYPEPLRTPRPQWTEVPRDEKVYLCLRHREG